MHAFNSLVCLQELVRHLNLELSDTKAKLIFAHADKSGTRPSLRSLRPLYFVTRRRWRAGSNDLDAKEFEVAMVMLQHELGEGCGAGLRARARACGAHECIARRALGQLGFSVAKLAAVVFGAAVTLLLVFVFIFLGIGALTTSTVCVRAVAARAA